MELKTKFNREDEIWFLANNKAISSFIIGIKIEVWGDGPQIVYNCHPDKEDKKPHVYLKVEEERAFASKQELLNSL